MKAACWHGTKDMRVETVPDPEIINPRDAIVKITSTAICGSDLHLYNGWNPTMKSGDILGHEFMGEIVELGSAAKNGNVKVGDRVVVPFTISCGSCFFCQKQLWSLCDNPTLGWQKPKWATLPLGCLATPISLVAMQADRQNMREYHLQIPGYLRFPMV